MEPFVAVSRRLPVTRSKPGARAAEHRRIREWAAANGYDVAPRGRIATAVVEAYHSDRTKSDTKSSAN